MGIADSARWSAAFMPLQRAHSPDAPNILTHNEARTVKRHKCRAPSRSHASRGFEAGQLYRFGPQLRTVSIAHGVNVFEPVLIVRVWKILAVMSAAAVFAQER